MRSGRLRHTVTLQARAVTKNNLGEPNNTWSAIAARRAAIEPLMGTEFYADSGEHSRLTTRIRVRYDSALATLKPYDRVVDQSVSPMVIYDIESVQNPKERNRELVLMCKRSG